MRTIDLEPDHLRLDEDLPLILTVADYLWIKLGNGVQRSRFTHAAQPYQGQSFSGGHEPMPLDLRRRRQAMPNG
ncbi:hypothetical protein D3C77_546770 [compost metagenome]